MQPLVGITTVDNKIYQLFMIRVEKVDGFFAKHADAKRCFRILDEYIKRHAEHAWSAQYLSLSKALYVFDGSSYLQIAGDYPSAVFTREQFVESQHFNAMDDAAVVRLFRLEEALAPKASGTWRDWFQCCDQPTIT